jgi:hypothetical protein
MSPTVTNEELNQEGEKCLVPKIYRGHELHLAIDPLPPLSFFTGGKELLPS